MEYSESNSSISECVICLEELNSDYHTLPCSHVIHKQCFDEYLSYNIKTDLENNIYFTECPICKTQMQINNFKNNKFCLYIGASLLVCSCTFIISNLIIFVFKKL